MLYNNVASLLGHIIAYVRLLSCLPTGPSHGLCVVVVVVVVDVVVLLSGACRRPVAPVAPVLPVGPVVTTQRILIDVRSVVWWNVPNLSCKRLTPHT